jgi:hypothetical protein
MIYKQTGFQIIIEETIKRQQEKENIKETEVIKIKDFSYHYIETKEHSPSVVLIVVIKLIVDVNWSFHMFVHLQRKLKTHN